MTRPASHSDNALSGHIVAELARRVLEDAWIPGKNYCPPNRHAYPHQWLWDSCFHAIAWSYLDDARCVLELDSLFRTQLADGCVPHIRYDGDPGTIRGPLATSSSYTQPPIYAHAARVLTVQGFDVGTDLISKIADGLEYLWRERRTPEGLMFIVHPWESGADDSPRWDDWLGMAYDRPASMLVDLEMVAQTYFNTFGSAVWSRRFAAAPAAFNALTAHAFSEMALLTGKSVWAERSSTLAQVIDDLLWDDAQGLWNDLALLGGGASVSIPTADGVLPALVTKNSEYAQRSLEQLEDESRFAAPFGLAYTARLHPSFDPVTYWRGPAWPQLNYLFWLTAKRWGRRELGASIARQSIGGAVRSKFAEYWNPLTGEGLGAVPQTWAAVVSAYLGDEESGC